LDTTMLSKSVVLDSGIGVYVYTRCVIIIGTPTLLWYNF